MCACVYVRARMCVRMRAYACVRKCVHVCLRVCMGVSVRKRVCVHVGVCLTAHATFINKLMYYLLYIII